MAHAFHDVARARRWRRGFTLVELLVVAGIIAVLIGVALVVVPRVRAAAGATACQSNLRQWGAAATLFAAQHDGAIPRRGQGQQPVSNVSRPEDWFNALPPLLGQAAYSDLAKQAHVPRPGGGSSIWMCPQAGDPGGTHVFAYAMNMRLSTWQASQPDHLAAVGPAATQVFMTEGPGPYCSVLPSAQAYSPVARHGGRVNVCFLDGHVESLDGKYVGCGTGDPGHADVQWVVPHSAWGGPDK